MCQGSKNHAIIVTLSLSHLSFCRCWQMPVGSLTHVRQAALLHNLIYGRLHVPGAGVGPQTDLCHRLVASNKTNIQMILSSPKLGQGYRKGTKRLPVLDDAHHGSSHAHVDDLCHLSQEVFLDLETALPNAPAAIHEEG